jgi:hypothetical protein
MSPAGNTPAASRPSVFISYASEDRAAARLLRDTLLAAGLDVWYDESELGGGDAWDQKLRRQIRDCDYFMPVISATTERRKEGYFRREWRLAAERTLDMADDVLFLLPVVLDETAEVGARVPEKFLSVQWLRAPGGQRTPSLDALVQRLLAGEHTVSVRPPLVARPAMASSGRVPLSAGPTASVHVAPPSADSSAKPPPMPPFPPAPEKGGAGHWIKFAAEIAWWGVTAVWLLFTRLPRWLRIILSLWLVFMLISTCSRDSNSRPKSKQPAEPAPAVADQIDRVANAAGERIASALDQKGANQDWGKLGEELGRQFGSVIGQATAVGKTLALPPFVPDQQDPAGSQFAQAVLSSCYGKLVLARKGEVVMSPVLATGTSDASFAALGQQLRTGFVLGLRLTKGAGDAHLLSASLVQSEGGRVAWSGEFPIDGGDANEVGTKIAEAILPLLPPKK